MSPPGRNDDKVAGTSVDGETAPGIIGGIFLHVDERLACPNLVNLGRRPATVGGNSMDVTLAPDRFVAKTSSSVRNSSVQHVAAAPLGLVGKSADVHRDRIHRVGSV